MGYSNGQLESSTKTGKGEKGDPGLPGIGFNLTDDGNFDLDGKRLTDVADPINDRDAATKAYVDSHAGSRPSSSVSKAYVDSENAKQDIAIADKASKNSLNEKLNIDGSNLMSGSLNMNNNKIKGLLDGIDANDAVNKKQLESHTDNNQTNYHLQPSFSFYKNFGDFRKIIPNQLWLHQPDNFFINNHYCIHRDVLTVQKEGFDNGFGGQAWTSIKMTNDKLPAGVYTAIFEIFSARRVILTDETLIFNVSGDSHYNVITFSHDRIDNQYTKAYIQFSSDGQRGEITFQIKYYGNKFNKAFDFIFYSRVISGKQNTHFNHNVFNVSSADDNREILYYENINLNSNKINGLADPTKDSDAANKGYVDTEIAKMPQNTLLLDGSKSMKGNLDMDKKNILNLENLTDYKVDDPLDYRIRDLGSAVNKQYLNSKFLKKDSNDNYFDLNQKLIRNCEPYYDGLFSDNDLVTKAFVDKSFFKSLWTNGANAMRGDLDMSNNQIFFLDTPVDDIRPPAPGVVSQAYPKDQKTAVNKFYIDEKCIKLNNNNKFDFRGKAAVNIKPFVEDDSSQEAQNAQLNHLINFGYFHTQRGELKRLINMVSAEALNLKNPDPMQDDIDMGNHSIVNLKDPKPHNSNYAASVNFVNRTITDNNATITTNYQKYVQNQMKYSVKSADKVNAFQYIMDNPAGQFTDEDDIKGIRKTEKDYHKINRETYEMQLQFDSRGYYSSRLGVNMFSLPTGEYSLVYELYFPNSIDRETVQISAVSSVETVSRVTTNVFSDHSRSIIHIHKWNNVSPNRLMIDMILKNKAGIRYANNLTIFVIVYGVSGYQNDVPTSVWDRVFEIVDKTVKFETDLDMNNRQIKNLGVGNENSDAVNVRQINDLETNIQNYLTQNYYKKSDVESVIANRITNAITNLKHLYKFDLLKLKYFSDDISLLPNLINKSKSNTGTIYIVFNNIPDSDGYSFKLEHKGGIHGHFRVHIFVLNNEFTISHPTGTSKSKVYLGDSARGKKCFVWINLWDGDFKYIGSNFSLKDYSGEYFLANYQYIKFIKGQNNIVSALFSKEILETSSFAYKEFRQLRIEDGTVL